MGIRVALMHVVWLGGFVLPLMGQERAAVPSAESQQEQVELLKEVFPRVFEPQADSAEQIVLARLLLRESANMKDDLAAEFVMLRYAFNLAVSNKDLETVGKVCHRASERFDVDGIRMRGKAISSVLGMELSKGERLRLYGFTKDTIEQATKAGSYEVGEQLAELLVNIVKPESMRTLRERAVGIREWARHQSATAKRDDNSPLRTAYEKDNTDAEAALAYGLELCRAVGDWDKGTEVLSHGSDPAIAAAAKLDRAAATAPGSAADSAAIGAAWYKIGKQPERDFFLARALFWYKKTDVDSLAGLTVMKVRARTEELSKIKFPKHWIAPVPALGGPAETSIASVGPDRGRGKPSATTPKGRGERTVKKLPDNQVKVPPGMPRPINPNVDPNTASQLVAQLKQTSGVSCSHTSSFPFSYCSASGTSLTSEVFEAIARLPFRTLSMGNYSNDLSLNTYFLIAASGTAQRLSITSRAIPTDGLKAISQMRSLKNLSCFGTAELEGVAVLAHLKQLKELRIYPMQSDFVEPLSSLPNLEKLELGQAVTEDNIDFIVGMRTLKSILMRDCRLSDDAFRKLTGHPSVESLSLPTGVTKECLPVLKSLPNLNWVMLRTADHLNLISELPKIGLKTGLSISGTTKKVGDTISTWRGQGFVRVRFSGVLEKSSLDQLANCQFDKLEIHQSGIDDSWAEAILKLRVRSLSLTGTSLSPAAQNAIKQRFPGAYIH